MGRLTGRVAIVTGAAQGIGAAYARALAAEGAKVVIADVVDGEALAAEIRAASGNTGGDAIALTTDVSDEAACRDMVRETVERFGKLDILVNNAAIFSNIQRKPFLEIEVAEWDALMAVNVRGVFLCCKAAVPEMRRAGYGRIINIASGTVFKGMPTMLHYVASKGAVVALSRALAREVGVDGICVNTLAPGLVMTENVLANESMLALSDVVTASRAIQREQVPEDLTGTLVFLASDDCAFTTGQVMVVDGGSIMH